MDDHGRRTIRHSLGYNIYRFTTILSCLCLTVVILQPYTYAHSYRSDRIVDTVVRRPREIPFLRPAMSNTFLYFAYGSNLLAKRIHINNPTAVRRGIGRLKNFRLDFVTYSKRWHGASATIVPTEGHHVWGAIWEIHDSNMESLDRQEGVADQIYSAHTVDVETPSGSLLSCRVYEQCNNPRDHLVGDLLPQERRPSLAYRNTILKGAQESGLPAEYIKFLETFPHNGYIGEPDVGLSLSEIETRQLSSS